jgi:hypothetical protein
MGTFELLIVFAALMAVIALVAIAIDWVGRPLKNRRFIPRIYRYEDEVSPEDDYGLQPPLVSAGPPLSAAPPVVMTPPPHPVAPPVTPPPPAVAAPPPASMAPVRPEIIKPSTTTIAAELAPRPPTADAAPVAHPDSIAPSATGPASTSAFQDTIGPADEPVDFAQTKPRGIAETVSEQSASAWTPGMPLDARVNDANPTPDEKAARYWIATADGVGSTTHFDAVNLARMAQGKAPTRRNPRSGDVEAMDLVGLRAASHRSDVRMKWPDETVDPWSAS